jgi:hypothetical protein
LSEKSSKRLISREEIRAVYGHKEETVIALVEFRPPLVSSKNLDFKQKLRG